MATQLVTGAPRHLLLDHGRKQPFERYNACLRVAAVKLGHGPQAIARVLQRHRSTIHGRPGHLENIERSNALLVDQIIAKAVELSALNYEQLEQVRKHLVRTVDTSDRRVITVPEGHQLAGAVARLPVRVEGTTPGSAVEWRMSA